MSVRKKSRVRSAPARPRTRVEFCGLCRRASAFAKPLPVLTPEKLPSKPPASVPAVDPDIRGAVTIRQQLEKHRADESCAACHRKIDPPGFALENFDVMGGWRDRYRSSSPAELYDTMGRFGKNGAPLTFRLALPVDAAGQLADAKFFALVLWSEMRGRRQFQRDAGEVIGGDLQWQGALAGSRVENGHHLFAEDISAHALQQEISHGSCAN